MAFTSEKRWPVGIQTLINEEKGTAGASTMSWPCRSVANFSKLPQEPGAKMILTPKAYHATHNTMPPPSQVITMASTHTVMKEQYQAVDRKVAGKRNTDQSASNTRPPKHFRPCE